MVEIGWDAVSSGVREAEMLLELRFEMGRSLMGRGQPCDNREGEHSRQRKEQMERL